MSKYNWGTKIKGKAPYEGLVIFALDIRVFTKDNSTVF